MDLPDSDWGDFSCRRAVDSSSLFYIIDKSSNYIVAAIDLALLLIVALAKQIMTRTSSLKIFLS